MIPNPDREMAGLFSRSEEMLQDHCKLYATSKAELKDLIQKVLHHPDFDPGQVDHDMHERLMLAIEEEDILIWDKWEEGDGRNDCSFYQRPLKKVLEELLSDTRLEGHQHFRFEAKYDSKGDRIFGGDANGTLSFQLAQLRIGPDKVPVSIVLYIDKTFMRRGIPIRPVYCKISYTISHTISYTILHPIFFSQMFILFFFCLLTLASGCSGKPEQ